MNEKLLVMKMVKKGGRKIIAHHKTKGQTKQKQKGDSDWPFDVDGILTSNKHDYDRIKLFDGGVWSNIAEPNAGESRENKIHTRNISRLKIH